MSEIDPLDVSIGAKRPMGERFNQDLTDLPSTPGAKRPEREGLPPGYRMRADAHYVDNLTTRRAERSHSDTPRSSPPSGDVSREPPAPREPAQESRSRRSDRVLSQVAQDVSTIESAALMLAAEASPLARRVSVDLIRAQAFRATWLARASAILDGTHRGQVRLREIGAMLSHVRDSFAAECRLSGVTLEVHASEWTAAASADQQSMIAAIGGAIFATLALAGETSGLKVKVSIVASAGELRQIEVTQDDVTVGVTIAGRFFDQTWSERPGGWLTDVAASTVRTVAEQHGGQATLVAGEQRGTTIRLGFNRSAAN